MAIIKHRGNSNAPVQGMAMRLTRADPNLAAAVSKAVQGHDPRNYNERGDRAPAANQFYAFYSALTRRAQRNSDSLAIIKMLPDIALAQQILVSSILSPKDMMTLELIYSTSTDDFQSDLANSLIDRLRAHFVKDYPIEKHIADMVREPLFEKGAYPVVVLPENAIDQMINGKRQVAMESLNAFFDADGSAKPLGILGPGRSPEALDPKRDTPRFGIAQEDFKLDLQKVEGNERNLQYHDRTIMGVAYESYVTVTDNPSALKTNKLVELLKKRRIGKTYDLALESVTVDKITKVNDRLIERAVFRPRNVRQATVTEVPGQNEVNRNTVGNPLIMKLPSESVIPVHVPGDPSRHIGYYVILDENGNPVYAPESDLLSPNLANQSGQGSVSSGLIQRAAINMGVGDANKFDMHNYQHMQAAVQVYGDMVERDLINRVRNGAIGINAVVARNEEIYRLMLSRVLARKYTQVLYVPVEYMTYIAFNYGSDGVGRSMLDDQSMISMLRATMLFADVIGSIKNSIGRTRVEGTIPADDPDPMSTVEKIMHEIVQSRKLNLPLGVSNPADIVTFIQSAGFEFNLSGHSGLPDMKMNFEQVQSNYQKPDQDLADKLRKASIMGFGLSPETVDNGFNSEFATTAVANNVLLSKRVIMWQNEFCPQLTQHMRQAARFSEKLTKDLYDILKTSKEKILLEVEFENGQQVEPEMKDRLLLDYALRKFLDSFNVALPQPSSVTLESQKEELQQYVDILDLALDAYVTPDMFTETTSGPLSEQMGTLKAMLKAYFVRKWMVERGIMPELGEITTTDTEGKPQTNLIDEMKNHIESLTKAGVFTLAKLSANRQAASADLGKEGIDAVAGPEASSSFGGGSSGGGGGSMDFGGDMGGGLGDLGGGDDLDGGADSGSAGSGEESQETDADEPGGAGQSGGGDDAIDGGAA